MLVVPSKKADACDPLKPLSAFFQKEYGNEAERYNESLSSYQNIRNNALFVNSSSGQLGFHNILRYNYHMASMSKRLSGYESEIKFVFSWIDAFQPSKRVQSGSLYFDWACVLWNLAALESSRGAHLDRSTNEGVRAASGHFQQAAGVFSFLKTDVVPKIKGVKSQELSEQFLSVMLELNLAQAQVCFYEKAVRDMKAGSMKAGLVAKLARQVAKFYEQAVSYGGDREVSRCIDPSWIHHMSFQRECFLGASEYWQAQAVKEEALATGRGYGEEITRLARAEEKFTRTVELGKSKRIHSTTLSTAETFLDTVKRMKFSAVKDNSTIYHDKVPGNGAVSEVTPISMVKPSTLPAYPTNPNITPEAPLFADVVPKEVRSLVTQYRDRVANMVSRTQTIVNNTTNSGRSALSAMGLPGSLEVYKSGGAFPSNLWKKIQNMQSRAGNEGLSADLFRKVGDLEKLSQRARSTIDSIDYSIRREEDIDNNFRTHFPKYSIPKSSELNQDIRRNVETMKQAHDVAKSNDQTMISRINGPEFQEYLRLLGLSRSELEGQLPRGGGSEITKDVETSDLEEYLVKIATLFENREDALKDLRDHANDFDVAATDAFIDAVAEQTLQSSQDKEDLIRAQLRSLEPYTNKVTCTLTEQSSILEDIAEANQTFLEDRCNDPLQKDRENFIKKLEQAVSSYSQILSQLNAGSTFYMDMQSRLTSIVQQCDDLSYTQQIQRHEYEVQCNREQDRENQEKSDHDLALRLANEMDNVNLNQRIATEEQLTEQKAQQQHGYPQLQQGHPPHMQQSQPPPHQSQSQQHAPQGTQPQPYNKMNVAYGQPIASPPGHHPLEEKEQSNQAQQQMRHPLEFSQHQQQQQQQQPAAWNFTGQSQPNHAPSHPLEQQYGQNFAHNQPRQQPTHFQDNTQRQEPYVYNAGFNSSGVSERNVSNPSGGYGQQPKFNPSYQPQSHPQSQPPTTSLGQGPQIDEAKVNRLMEMGFPRYAVISHLEANNNNEEAALNGLLCSNPEPQPPPPPCSNNQSNQNNQNTGNSTGGGGFFGRLWGS